MGQNVHKIEAVRLEGGDPLILTLEGQNNRDHLTFGLTLPPLPLRLITKNSSLIKDQPSKSLFFYSDLVSYRQL